MAYIVIRNSACDIFTLSAPYKIYIHHAVCLCFATALPYVQFYLTFVVIASLYKEYGVFIINENS